MNIQWWKHLDHSTPYCEKDWLYLFAVHGLLWMTDCALMMWALNRLVFCTCSHENVGLWHQHTCTPPKKQFKSCRFSYISFGEFDFFKTFWDTNATFHKTFFGKNLSKQSSLIIKDKKLCNIGKTVWRTLCVFFFSVFSFKNVSQTKTARQEN